MIDWLAPSLTKNVPMIEVMMQTPPIASGKVIMLSKLRRAGEEDRGQHHGGDGGHRIGLEQVGGHAGAVADVVADVVGDGRGIARIVLGDAGLDLADQVAADVGALGEDAAAETGEDRDQRGAEAERDQGVDHGARVGRKPHRAGQDRVVDGDAEQREAGDQHAGDGAGLEGELKPAGKRGDRGLRGAHVGAHRDVHADEAGGARKHRADQEADADQPAEQIADDQEDHDADDADGGVLALEIGLRAFAHGGRDLLHPRAAGVRLSTDMIAQTPYTIASRPQTMIIPKLS